MGQHQRPLDQGVNRLEKRGDGVLEEDESGMTKGRLTRGGWISIANGLFTVPAVGMSFYLGSDEGIGTAMAQALLTLVSLGLFLYILSTLKLLLNVRFRFHEVDVFISYLMWGNLSLSLFHLLTLITREFEWAVGVLSVIAYIFFGILFLPSDPPGNGNLLQLIFLFLPVNSMLLLSPALDFHIRH